MAAADWTLAAYMEHAHLLRECDRLLVEADLRFQAERDRRYTEGGLLRAEALRIKEEGDRRALELAREIQTYKDEQANRLREQINQERGQYATHADIKAIVEKFEALIAPLAAYVATQSGHTGGLKSGREWIGWVMSLVLGGIAMLAWLAK